MKISTIESLHCDAGWRNFSFLKITTDDGIVGYSEYNQSYGSKGVSGVIDQLAPIILGLNPLENDVIFAMLYATTRQAPGGINSQAIAAIENALMDIKGKALGVPVYQLLGGAMRERLRLYWSHCGTYRMHESTAGYMGRETLTSLDDVRALGEEVKTRGFTGLKCNMYVFGERNYTHGWRRSFPDRLAERPLIRSVYNQIEAFNEGTGGDVDILLDLNFNFNTEGYIRMIRALTPLELFWCELDIFNPEALAYIRNRTSTPIASCESVYGIRDFRAVLSETGHGRGYYRRSMERDLAVLQDCSHCRCTRSECSAAQFLRPSLHHDERPLLCGIIELPHHGNRHR